MKQLTVDLDVHGHKRRFAPALQVKPGNSLQQKNAQKYLKPIQQCFWLQTGLNVRQARKKLHQDWRSCASLTIGHHR